MTQHGSTQCAARCQVAQLGGQRSKAVDCVPSQRRCISSADRIAFSALPDVLHDRQRVPHSCDPDWEDEGAYIADVACGSQKMKRELSQVESKLVKESVMWQKKLQWSAASDARRWKYASALHRSSDSDDKRAVAAVSAAERKKRGSMEYCQGLATQGCQFSNRTPGTAALGANSRWKHRSCMFCCKANLKLALNTRGGRRPVVRALKRFRTFPEVS